MYGSYGSIESRGKEGKRPHIQCENSHSMGNSMGNVRDMFDLYEKYACLTGEFIWDFKDQGLLTSSSSGTEYWAYGGDFGDNPNDGNFCINGLVRPDWSYTSKTYNTKKIYQPLEFNAINGKTTSFLYKNKMAFLPSTVYDVSYTIEDEEQIETGRWSLEDSVLTLLAINDVDSLVTSYEIILCQNDSLVHCSEEESDYGTITETTTLIRSE